MPRNCSVYSSSDEKTYNSSRWYYSHSHLHQKTHSPSSSRHRNITSRHSPSHSDTRGKGIEADHSLEQGKKGMEADHALAQSQRKGGDTVDLIQGTFTQIKDITDHDHIQNPEAVAVFWHHPTMHLVARVRCLPPLNISSTAHDRVPGIGRKLQSIVHHTLAQTRERIEADHSLKQGAKGMKASHSLIQRKGKGRGRGNLIQEIFTQTKSIT